MNIASTLGVKDVEFCKRLVDWADIIRKTFYDGGIEEIISTRRLVHILNAYAIFKNKAKAIQTCINRFDDETKQSFLELYDKVDDKFDMPEKKNLWVNYKKVLHDTFDSSLPILGQIGNPKALFFLQKF